MKEKDWLQVYNCLKQIQANTFVIHLPAFSQEEGNKKRAKEAKHKRECLQKAIDLVKVELIKEFQELNQ